MYKAPLKDIRFVLEHVIGFEALMAGLGRGDDVPLDVLEAVLREAGRFAAEVIAPTNHGGDMAPSVLKSDGSVVTPPGFAQAYRAMGAGGWTAMEASEAYGGQNMPWVLSAMINEIWQSANMSFALCHLLTQGQIYALERSASAEQKALFIPPLVEGRWTGTMNLTEPQAGTDLGAIKTKAVKDGRHYRISGQKIYITYGEHDMAENIIHLVLARTPDAAAGVRGISLFIVPKILVNEDGTLGSANDVRCVSLEKKLGIKASPTAVLSYGDEGGAEGYLVGEEGCGLEIMFGMMNHARFAVGLQGLAISERAFQQAASYAFERRQGTPLGGVEGDAIIHHPDVLRLITVMKSEIEAMRALACFVGSGLDLAEAESRAESGAESGSDFWQVRTAVLIPIVKGWLTERAQALTSMGLQVHGGMGFIEETGAAQHYRDARILSIYEGTTAIQANDLVFRKTVRDEGAAVRSLLGDIEAEMKALSEHRHAAVKRGAGLMLEAVAAGYEAVACVLGRSNAPRRAAASSVDYLMLMGVLMGGWLMVRAAGKAADLLAQADADEAFLNAKIASADAYIHHALPQVFSLLRVIESGDAAVLAMQTEWLKV